MRKTQYPLEGLVVSLADTMFQFSRGSVDPSMPEFLEDDPRFKEAYLAVLRVLEETSIQLQKWLKTGGTDNDLSARIPDLRAVLEDSATTVASTKQALETLTNTEIYPLAWEGEKYVIILSSILSEIGKILDWVSVAKSTLLSDLNQRTEERYDSVFISYGGRDEPVATYINNYLKQNGIRTWFFPQDAHPGQKLHRVMSDGVNSHDRVLLICSKSSLSRYGVLNEIERALEREAREGGADILIPVAIDNYVFTMWKPARMDVAEQLRSRVIVKFPVGKVEGKTFREAADRLVTALRR